MLRNTPISYGSIAKFFHWTIFVLVLGLLIVGSLMSNAPDGIRGPIYTFHKSTGLLVLLLMTLRLGWTLINPKPQSAPGTSPIEHKAEWSGHFLLYILLFAMPLSGWVMSVAAGHIPNVYGLFELTLPGIPEDKIWADTANMIHGYLAWVIVAMVSLHILAALWHHYIKRDNTLKRMLPERRRR